MARHKAMPMRLVSCCCRMEPRRAWWARCRCRSRAPACWRWIFSASFCFDVIPISVDRYVHERTSIRPQVVDNSDSLRGFKPSTSICQTLKFQQLAAQWEFPCGSSGGQLAPQWEFTEGSLHRQWPGRELHGPDKEDASTASAGPDVGVPTSTPSGCTSGRPSRTGTAERPGPVSSRWP